MFTGRYRIRLEKVPSIREKYRVGYIAKEVGVSMTYLSCILKGKKRCSKLVAHYITKVIDEKAEIEDYFYDEVGE